MNRTRNDKNKTEMMMMTRTMIDLFCGTKSVANAFKEAGWDVFTIDNDPVHKPDLCADIMTLRVEDVPERFRKPDFIHASPPCTHMSVAVISKNWTKSADGKHYPKNDATRADIALFEKTLSLFDDFKTRHWTLENPRGMARHLRCLKNHARFTITYCQYGDKRMKPTDIWTNMHAPGFKPPCKNRDPCHPPAPRGSRTTGTQSLSDSIERSKIPKAFCGHLAQIGGGRGMKAIGSFLWDLEWSGTYSYCTGWPCCPTCKGIKPGHGADEAGRLPLNQGHRDGCRLVAALSQVGMIDGLWSFLSDCENTTERARQTALTAESQAFIEGQRLMVREVQERMVVLGYKPKGGKLLAGGQKPCGV